MAKKQEVREAADAAPKSETSPGFETQVTGKSSDKAAAQNRRDDIRSGREDLKGPMYAGDNNSVRERYARTLARLDGVIGRTQAEKRKVLSALSSLEVNKGMGEDTSTFREQAAGNEFDSSGDAIEAAREPSEEVKELRAKVHELREIIAELVLESDKAKVASDEDTAMFRDLESGQEFSPEEVKAKASDVTLSEDEKNLAEKKEVRDGVLAGNTSEELVKPDPDENGETVAPGGRRDAETKGKV